MTSRYHSPSATPRPRSPKSLTTEPLTVEQAAAAAGDLDEEGDHVERDQHEGRGRGAEGARRARCPGDAGPLARALRAAHADRGRRHALGADRPPAGGAGDAGLTVRVSVTGLRHGNRGAYNRAALGPRPLQQKIAGRKPREALRDPGRRRPRDRRHRRLLLQRLVRRPRRSRRRLRAVRRQRLAQPRPHPHRRRSACSSPASPPAATRSGWASSTWASRSGASCSAAATSILGFFPVNTEDNLLHLALGAARGGGGAGDSEGAAQPSAPAERPLNAARA